MAPRPLSALLDRFRRGVAVPAAAGDDLAIELAPVFASLELIEAEVRELQLASARKVEDRLASGLERAAVISAGWRELAEAERAQAAEERRRRARDEAAKVEAQGRAEASRIRTQASARSQDLVRSIVECVEKGLP